MWFSGLIGKRPPGVRDTETVWEHYAQMTQPKTSPTLALGGRAHEREQLLAFLAGPPGVLGVQAESQDEAIAFLLACIQDAGDMERDTLLARAVLVDTPDAFHTLLSSPTPLVLVPTVHGLTGMPAAAAAGHHVLVPHGRAGKIGGETITLPRPDRQAVQEALDGMGVAESRRAQLGRLGRRSLQALRRTLATAPEFETPLWADPARAFPAPVLLAGMWNDNSEGDQQVISRLGRAEYLALARMLNGWAVGSDPPVRRTGAAWMVSAPEDAWRLVNPLLLPQDITTFGEVALAVLGESDPSVMLPPDEQVMQRGLAAPRLYSDVLRDGLADTLALLGAHAGDPNVSPLKLQALVTQVVTTLLGPPATWEVWATLARWLPLLAEAAPEAFLDAAEQLAAEPEVPLARLIQDAGHTIFFHSPHSHLLWALEILAWNPQYLARVARVLFALARHDLPTPDTLTRPLRSLKWLLDGTMPSTTASVSQRLTVLMSLSRVDSSLFAQLLQALLPLDRGWKMEPATPRYRDWVPDRFPIATHEEYVEYQDGVVRQLLQAGQNSPDLLAFLLQRAHLLTTAQRAATVQALRTYVNREPHESESAATLRDALRSVLRENTERRASVLAPEVRAKLQAAVDARDATDEQRLALMADLRWAHQSFTPQELTDIQTLLTTLSPPDIVEQSAWLFEVNPTLPSVSRFEFNTYWTEVGNQRREATAQVWTARGREGVEALARRGHEASGVGQALAETGLLIWDEEAALLRETLAHETVALANLARSYLTAKSSSGSTWMDRVRRELVPTWTAAQQVTFFLTQPAEPDTWQAIQTAGTAVQEGYWHQVPVWSLPTTSFEQAVRGLLSRGRSFAALHYIAQYGRSKGAVSVDTVVEALEQASKVKPTDHLKDVQGMPYLLTRLIWNLSPAGTVSLARLAELEWHLWDCLHTFDQTPPNLSRQLVDAPEFFVQLVTWAYYSDLESQERPAPTQSQLEMARRAREVLRGWTFVPGRSPGETFDETQWHDWVGRVRTLAAQQGYNRGLDIELATLIARALRTGSGNGLEPAVCDTIEQLASDRLDRLIGMAVQNGRGIVTKAAYEGGRQEQALAQTFAQHAEPAQIQFPRVARILNQLGRVYQDEAQDEDTRAAFDQDQ
ncbi:hypothetical protein GCM10008961_38500 [Deinococcus knuensis]|uniref:ATP-binding protein n=2 Tax=Deinococcus knuensis TaxID=1837380 RepID=A0ABQ2SY59_9DEIO|nr:hypothetical protein GCM10008961_38500 [Deinococcus knuensis]